MKEKKKKKKNIKEKYTEFDYILSSDRQTYVFSSLMETQETHHYVRTTRLQIGFWQASIFPNFLTTCYVSFLSVHIML
jgi:hypothetical protein